MIGPLLLAELAPCLAALWCVRALQTEMGKGWSSKWFSISLAFGVGTGAAACTHFGCVTLVGTRIPNGDVFLWLVLALAAVGIVFVRRRRLVSSPVPTSEATSGGRSLWAAFSIALLASVIAFWSQTEIFPLGWDDSITIWNLHARYLARGGPGWTDLFRCDPSGELTAWHADYPLLLPAAVARLWGACGVETPWAPRLVAIGFWLATIGVVTSGVAMLRGTKQGLLAGLALLATVRFALTAASQCADVPLSFYIVATLLLLVAHDELRPSTTRGLVLPGLAAGMAAWTKNEGLLFVVVILLARAAAWGRRAFSANFIKQLAWLATGLAAVLVVVVCFKVIVAPANDLLAGQSLPVAFARLTTFARWTTVGTAFGREYFSVGKILAWVLPLYLVLVGLRPGAFRERGTRTIWLTLGGMLLGYWMAYVLTPHPLDWHLNSSAGRLLIQLWPALVAGTFLSTPSQS